MEIRILSRKLIKPSASTPPHLRILKLSPVDQAYPIKATVLFYYSAEGGSTGCSEEVERRRIIKSLETSLSDTLTRFYPLAGRYVDDGNWVDCNDEGAEFFVAKAKGCRLCQFLSRRDEMIDQLSHLAGGAATSPLVSVQINMFECGGMIIGIRISHRLSDGFSFVSFSISWASTNARSRQGEGIDNDDREAMLPTFGLTSILPLPLPANDLNLPKAKPMHPFVGLDKTVIRRLVFDKAKISALRERAHDPSFPREPSRVELVTALIWRALMRVSRAKHGRLRTSLAAQTMNLRPIIVPPLPPLSCGNLITKVTTKFVPESSGGGKTDSEVPELKELVCLLIHSFIKPKLGREDVFPTLLKTWNELHEVREKGDVDVFMFTSWCRIPFYQVDFGWGKPVWVSRIPLPYESTTFVDAEDGDGIEAWLCFNKKDMSLFLRDEGILAFMPPVFGNLRSRM